MGDNFEEALEVLAKTIWGEARGEGLVGMQAVANVIMNRVEKSEKYKRGFWWGKGIIGVCKKPWQFSCWNNDDVNRAKLDKIDFENDFVYAVAEDVALGAMLGELEDITDGSVFYHAKSITPWWVTKGKKKPVKTIGNHVFYKL